MSHLASGPRKPTTREGSPDPPPDPHAAARAAFEKQGSDPGQVKSALADSANLARTLWISFLTFGTYLVITVSGVTHKQLFLEMPIMLPLLNAPLPLVTFFWVAPILFIIFHLYLLLNLKLLADQVHFYGELMAENEVAEVQCDRARLQLPNFVIVQTLGGTSQQRHSLAGAMLAFTAWMTLVLAPVILLMLMQLQFLPYHHQGVTWVHRLALLADLGLLWYFWPLIQQTTGSWGRGVLALSAIATALYFSWLVFTFPGERQDGAFVQKLPLPEGGTWDRVSFATIHEILFTTTGARANPEVPGFFTNTLILRDFQAIDPDLLKKIEERENSLGLRQGEGERTIDLHDRDFTNADFAKIDLRRAKLDGAILDGVSLGGASLQGASLYGAELQGAYLIGAKLQGVSLRYAKLHGASLFDVLLQGASLSGAELQGASLSGAELQGASLDDAKLQGASLVYARLQGASLDKAALQGASLNYTKLQGASFGGLSLLAAPADGADLQGASLQGSAVWRSVGIPKNIAQSLLRDTEPESLQPDDYQGLLNDALKGVRENKQESVKERLAILDPARADPERAIIWTSLQAQSASPESYPAILAGVLDGIACDGENAPYVARGIINNRLKAAGPAALPLIEKMLAPGTLNCPGAAGLGEDSLAVLRFLKLLYMSAGR
jgi:uncharacterized protein YjbI with pentapeptide repeats